MISLNISFTASAIGVSRPQGRRGSAPRAPASSRWPCAPTASGRPRRSSAAPASTTILIRLRPRATAPSGDTGFALTDSGSGLLDEREGPAPNIGPRRFRSRRRHGSTHGGRPGFFCRGPEHQVRPGRPHRCRARPASPAGSRPGNRRASHRPSAAGPPKGRWRTGRVDGHDRQCARRTLAVVARRHQRAKGISVVQSQRDVGQHGVAAPDSALPPCSGSLLRERVAQHAQDVSRAGLAN